MDAKKWRGWIVVMSILSLLMAVLTGCGGRENQSGDPGGEALTTIETAVTPMPLPDGAGLKHLYITHQGMSAGPYYILKTTDAGTYMKISNMGPDDWRMLDGEDIDRLGDKAEYLGFADTVKDCERASLVLLEDDGPLRELEEAIASAGALGWDGFQKTVSMPDVADSGDSYKLYLELTDGTAVTVDGYNAKPAGFPELLYRVEEIFHENRDYSHYQIEGFDSSPCTKLYVSFRKAFQNGEWRLELQRADNRWIVVLIDPKGYFMEAGAEIAEYQPMEGELPFDRFLEIFKRHGAECWNGYAESDGSSEDSFNIRLYFENGKEFFMSGSLLPDGFAAFQKEFIEELLLFYNEQTS